jgi:hypothetical protein
MEDQVGRTKALSCQTTYAICGHSINQGLNQLLDDKRGHSSVPMNVPPFAIVAGGEHAAAH